jgi:CDP-diglyceride synthetase
MFLVLAVEGVIFAYMLIGSYYRTQRDPVRKEKMNYERFKKEFRENYIDNPEKDIKRKALHVLPVIVIILCYHLSFGLSELGILNQAISPLGFYYFLVLTIALAFVQMFMLEDLCRLWNLFEAHPSWACDWLCHSMVPDELDTVLTSTPMVVALFPFIFAPIPVLFSVGIITALSDAFASIIGKKYGRNKWPVNKKKSIEGTMAAVVSIYVAVFAVYFIYSDVFNPLSVFAAATFASFIFIFIDVFITKISDNLLNPLLCGAAIYASMIIF